MAGGAFGRIGLLDSRAMVAARGRAGKRLDQLDQIGIELIHRGKS